MQDEASQLIAPLLEPSSGQRILDACAAPGGKTCHLLEIEPGIRLLAIDRDASRLTQVQDNLRRLGANCETRICDFLTLSARDAGGLFDTILLDAPCSATGTIRRHPDIKLLRQPADIARLCRTQTSMLEHAWQLLKPGGMVVYATCSILPQENERVVRNFLRTRDDAEVLAVNFGNGAAQNVATSERAAVNSVAANGHATRGPWDVALERENNPGHQLLPQINSHDGFYVARLRKVSAT